jgi:hypothetical protein
MDNNRKLNRNFGLIMGAFFLLLFIYKWVMKDRVSLPFGLIGFAFVSVAFLFPQILNPLRIGWDKLGKILGIINTFIILGLLYFIVIMPLGWIMKLLGKDVLKLKTKKVTTYWQQVNDEPGSSMKRQF